ncbi:response regulator receiver domain protein [Synechococcus sp. PCC 7335]|uniref:response regulator transcription factor n=1 Tax=Synechococcus sp. (strain ATCC 29403 / PCC 7335) TaxID=91464 RepID=UPI00017EE786|nr:response regulator transcription factor [Synechococcus sp. PCC 7335]EDX83891.1 response regulator receiver domain protein [Synechococcus sp. PCC 7335]
MVGKRFLVVDDHEAILEGTIPALQQQYPSAEIYTAQCMRAAEKQIDGLSLDLVIVDLSLPIEPTMPATSKVGVELLSKLMRSDDAPNLMVLSTNVKPLIRLKPLINSYGGGFVAMDKAAPIQVMLKSVEIALRGSIHLPPEVRARVEFDPKWLKVIELKYQEGLSDQAIARRLGVSDRTVRNYWTRIQDALQVYDDPSQDLRVQIQLAARRAGFIS